MKFGQLIEYNKRNRGSETSFIPLFLLFEKALYEVKEMICSLVSIYFDKPQLGIQ